MSGNSLKEAKVALRSGLKAARLGLDPATRHLAHAEITRSVRNLDLWQHAKRWFVYLSEAEEVATRELVSELLARPGTVVYAPVITSREHMEARAFRSFDELLAGRYGILAPLNGDVLEGDVDAVLTPGLGFTRQGDRMGLGAGYYDRWFARHPQGQRLALAYACQIVPELPTEPTDCPVDILVTEHEVIDTRRRG